MALILVAGTLVYFGGYSEGFTGKFVEKNQFAPTDSGTGLINPMVQAAVVKPTCTCPEGYILQADVCVRDYYKAIPDDAGLPDVDAGADDGFEEDEPECFKDSDCAGFSVDMKCIAGRCVTDKPKPQNKQLVTCPPQEGNAIWTCVAFNANMWEECELEGGTWTTDTFDLQPGQTCDDTIQDVLTLCIKCELGMDIDEV